MYDILSSLSVYLCRRLRGESRRQIDFRFGSCVRARSLVVGWKSVVFVGLCHSLFPLVPVGAPFPLRGDVSFVTAKCTRSDIEVKQGETEVTLKWYRREI